MKYLTIDGKQYRIIPHDNKRNVDLEVWKENSDAKKAKTGQDGRWAFDGCYNDMPHLAKILLNRATDIETVEDVETLMIAWENAVRRIVEGLEVK